MASLVHASIEMTLTWSPGEAEMVTVASWPGGRGGGSKVSVSFTPATSLREAARAAGCPDSASSSSPARSSAFSGSRSAPPSCTTTTAGVSGWPAVTLRTVSTTLPASCASARWYVVRLVANMATSAAAISTKTALRDMTLPPGPMSYPFADPQHPTRSTTREPSRELRKKRRKAA